VHRHLHHHVPWYGQQIPQTVWDVAGWTAGAVIVIVLAGLVVAIWRWEPPSF
jgi:hypothetical protein